MMIARCRPYRLFLSKQGLVLHRLFSGVHLLVVATAGTSFLVETGARPCVILLELGAR